MTNQVQLFERTEKEKAEWNKQVEKINSEIQKLEAEIADIKANKIYDYAFEWRFEFPDVLDDDGNFIGFDVVIGNPPYLRSEQINEFKPYFAQKYQTTHSKYDIYILFIEMAMSILKKEAKLCYIIPNPITFIPYATLIRKFILENSKIITLVDFGEQIVFENAVVNTCIILLEKTLTNKEHLIRVIKPSEQIERLSTFPINYQLQNDFNLQENYQFRTDIKNEDNLIIDKILKKSIKLSSVYYISKGIVAYSKVDNRKKDDFIFNSNTDNNYKPYLEGKDVSRFNISFKNNYLAYDEKIMSRPTFPELHEKPKLLIRAMSNSLQVTFDESGYFVDQKLIICSKRNIIEKYLKSSKLPIDLVFGQIELLSDLYVVGLLNSKLYNFYFIKSIKKGISILPEDIRNLPILPNVESNKIDVIVNKILSLKKDNPAADTTALEAEIDKMVYALYGLTEDEVKIVEGNK
jgi:hypothetical protein